MKKDKKYQEGGMSNTFDSMKSVYKNSYGSNPNADKVLQSKKRAKKDVLKNMTFKDGGSKKDGMKCNKPQTDRSDSGKKKVVKACDNGKEKLIRFGADGYKHNYSKEAKKSFRARHKCDSANDKLSARYWACKDLWGKSKKIGK